MDHYLDRHNSFNRLREEFETYGSLAVAFDFDDTVYDFHSKGRKYEMVIELLRDLYKLNCYLICWTGQDNPEFVENYLNENQIPFHSINEDPPFWQKKSRKIYANVFLDDRAGLWQVYQDLSEIVTLFKNK
jgi:FMN phosphatase YigB (HAD superfamily)